MRSVTVILASMRVLLGQRRSNMTIMSDRPSRVAGTPLRQSTTDNQGESMPQMRKPWVAPAWERLDTPMEITMYAGQR